MGTKTVLVVDDHGGFRACARRLLEAEGFVVVGEAHDAASGLDAARALRPDVVLLDVRLPDLDGLRASKRIGALNGGSAIVLTSSCDVDDLPGALAESPALGFIPKSELSGQALRELLASA
jgi:DNA-binding NarL/FixJ family response regulator